MKYPTIVADVCSTFNGLYVKQMTFKEAVPKATRFEAETNENTRTKTGFHKKYTLSHKLILHFNRKSVSVTIKE